MQEDKSKITFNVTLDENKVPETIQWTADDANIKDRDTKAIMLAVWDTNDKETLKMDLWTKEMPMDEMKIFYHQTLVSMADSFERATNDTKMAATMRDFTDYFAEKLNLLQKPNK